MATTPLSATAPAPAASPVPVRIPHVNRILVPVDFSEASAAAFRRAIDIASIYHSSLLLVHVMANQTANGMATILPGALMKLETDFQADLDRLQRQALDRGVQCTTVLRKGSVLDQVRDILGHQAIDLLVLATHGGRGLHGALLGSTAERLIRHTTVPVLTVSAVCNQPAWEGHARQILFAGDFAPETLCGLSLALGIQQTTAAQLSVVQAVPFGIWPDILSVTRQRIAALLPPGTEIHTPQGPVGRTVCQLARQLGVGLIALGVHKQTFARELFGTGLLEILLNAPCPVLSVRQCD